MREASDGRTQQRTIPEKVVYASALGGTHADLHLDPRPENRMHPEEYKLPEVKGSLEELLADIGGEEGNGEGLDRSVRRDHRLLCLAQLGLRFR